MKRIIRLAAAALLLAFAAGSSLAQTYPAKPVRIIVPFPPGGGADLVAKAPPDGYTLLITTTGHAVAPSLFRKLPLDPFKDFAAVSQITSTYLVLVANPAMPATLKELIALAKAQPGKLNYAHTGLGVAPHIVGEMLKAAAGINIVMVTYKGDAQTIPAMLANEAQMGFSPPTTVVGHVKAGRLRALAVSGAARGAAFPDVPTVTEVGYRDATYNGWVGFFAPAGTPRNILMKVSADTARALKMPDVAARLPGRGAEAAGTTPDEFAARYRADVARYAKIIKAAKVPLVD
ncbi:MAG: hypothetical protein A3G80_08375 [Betaproteobacteria bacterium RIFCSPLOWO2_12_FULL_62_13b]|nr:MAG: hypothetical protein A3G80_08375 [Betaproteobacteria bacterium RIFCSPLOWO2_12_FULL_62_13b]